MSSTTGEEYRAKNAERQRRLKEKLHAKGLIRVCAWVHESRREDLIAHAATLQSAAPTGPEQPCTDHIGADADAFQRAIDLMDPEVAIRQYRKDGMYWKEVARELNERGILTPRRAAWTAANVNSFARRRGIE